MGWKTLLSTVAAIALGVSAVPPAAAETVKCVPINSVPYTIVRSGVYCLTKNLSCALKGGNAITIKASNVTIDLNGYYLVNRFAPTNESNGIYAVDRQTITVRNGMVRGFKKGVMLDISPSADGEDSRCHLIEDMLADHNSLVGLMVYGRESTIRNNRVVATGGYEGDDADNLAGTIGIYVNGSNAMVLNNAVLEMNGRGYNRGIYAIGHNALIENNHISNTVNRGSATYGITAWTESAIVVRNTVSGVDQVGIGFPFVEGAVYRDNVTTDVAVPFGGGTDAGGNWPSP
jgi:hypothetical protein